MINKYTIRSDFADEFITQDVKEDSYEHIEKQGAYVKSNYIKVLLDENILGKAKGDYVSIECSDIHDHNAREQMVESIVENLHHMSFSQNKEIKKILIVGLGNRFITSDALGPGVANEILVTAHLYEHEDVSSLIGTRDVAVIQPGVMGQTGIESSRIIESVANEYKPDLVLVIDALATRSMDRINRVVQINNTGIQPGSGVGNHRQAINQETLQIPVIAIGVATVTSVGAILHETLQNAKQDMANIMESIRDATHLDLVVTPKSMDDELKQLIYIVSQSINCFVHPNFKEL